MQFTLPQPRLRTPVLDRLSYALTKREATPLMRVFHVAIGIAIVALLAQVRLQVGPVPITGQTFAVLLIGATFGRALAGITLGGYVLLGALGAPIFTGAASGLAALGGTTGGYLAGFIVAGWVLGALAQRGAFATRSGALLSMAGAHLIIYALGTAWLMYVLNVGLIAGLSFGVAPFVLGDMIKIVLAAEIMRATQR